MEKYKSIAFKGVSRGRRTSRLWVEGHRIPAPMGILEQLNPEQLPVSFSLLWFGRKFSEALCIKRRRKQRSGNRKEVQVIKECQVCLQISSSNLSSMIF